MRCDSSSERSTCPTRHSHPRLLDRFYEAGGRALDVANVYRDGESAQAVGGWLRARHSPDGIVVYAKGCHPPNCLPKLVPSEVDEARRLLGVEPDRRLRPAPRRAFAPGRRLRGRPAGAGRCGAHRWLRSLELTVSRLRELQSYLDRIGEDGLAVFSNHFSLAEMVAEPWPGCLAVDREQVLALADTDLLILAWSSLATGFFAGARPGKLGQPWEPSAARAGDRARRRPRNLRRGGRARVRPAPARLRAAGRRDALRGPPRRGAVCVPARVEPRAARVAGEWRAALRFLPPRVRRFPKWLRISSGWPLRPHSWQGQSRSPAPPPLLSPRPESPTSAPT